MAKGANQKSKLLYLVQILTNESDEKHPLTTAQLIKALHNHGISAERKSIYDDMEVLNQFGYDVVTVRGRSNSYFLGERPFQLAEVKLMVDAVQSAKFITAEKSNDLIRKICSLTSRHEGTLMQRQTHIQNRAKTINKRTYYNVDALHTAIAENKRVQFKYYQWVIDPAARRCFKNQPRRGGQTYEVSPWTLLWDDQYYYLVAYDETAAMMKHYRVDRMDKVTAIPTARTGATAYQQLNMAEYSKSVFGMFGGYPADVRIHFNNNLIGVVIDRFGQDIMIHPDCSGGFVLTAPVTVSPQFYSWVFGFGTEIKLLGPAKVVADYTNWVGAVQKSYQNQQEP